MDAQKALDVLLAGNRRFVDDRAERPRQDARRRREVAADQKPLAAVLGCSDSRVPAEIIFDCGLGDLFVVRTAGHVADEAVLGSLEYAVEYLACQLVLVLGHSTCGAVTAAVQGVAGSGHLNRLLTDIRPATVTAQLEAGDLVENAIRANVERVVRQLQASAIVLTEPGRAGRVRIIGAVYDLRTGAVTLLDRPETATR